MLNLDWRFFPIFVPRDPATAVPESHDLGPVGPAHPVATPAATAAAPQSLSDPT